MGSQASDCVLIETVLLFVTRLLSSFSFASLETSGPDVSPEEKLDKVIQLAELCIELIQQNEEHHAEVNK